MLFGIDAVADSGAPPRWLLLHSTLHGESGLVDLEALRAGASFDDAREEFRADDSFDAVESRLFAALAERLGLGEGDFGEAGTVQR